MPRALASRESAAAAPLVNELVFAAVATTLLAILALINPLHRVLELVP